MGKTTALFEAHQSANAKIVDFAGWDMPIHYGSQLKEHEQVRADVGMFDVSHMQAVDITGSEATAFLQTLLANDVAKLKNDGKALYSCMLNEQGGVIDDLIVYRRSDNEYRMVVNAGTAAKDIAWMTEVADGRDVTLDAHKDSSIIAVQGPRALEVAIPLLPADLQDVVSALKPFNAAWNDTWFVGRTGYTGEDGLEIILPNSEAMAFWQALAAAGVAPIGLGARDTLRLEAGMNLYGSDMTEETSPLESGLGWTIVWEPEDRDFIGRKALKAQQDAGLAQKLVGLVLEGRGVLRDHQIVDTEAGQGEITSGSFAPSMQGSIALARVPRGAEGDVTVEMRGKAVPARIVKPPFVRNGKVLV